MVVAVVSGRSRLFESDKNCRFLSSIGAGHACDTHIAEIHSVDTAMIKIDVAIEVVATSVAMKLQLGEVEENIGRLGQFVKTGRSGFYGIRKIH